jgi:hypothetical protein
MYKLDNGTVQAADVSFIPAARTPVQWQNNPASTWISRDICSEMDTDKRNAM